jgi:glycerol-1-phosphate dehydrogenase [NAD(P)+]
LKIMPQSAIVPPDMQRLFFDDFMSRFDASGVLACACGCTHRLRTRTIVVEQGALERSARLLARERGSRASLWVLSDDNTEQAAGERWKAGLKTAAIRSRVLPGRPRVVPTLELARKLAEEVRAASPDLLVAVGSGVISDLVKKISLDTGVPNWAVATAASVDAYTSATSAIRIGGYHSPMPTGISEAVICDLDVIASAPREMFLAGLGDLLAKILAYLDWNLSRIMTGEHYCALMSREGLDSARTAISAARRQAADPLAAARTLMDAVLTSGLAMQSLENSRSAASAEHTIAHFWEMAAAVGNEDHDLHGILAGAASRLVLHGYRRFYGQLGSCRPDAESRLADYERERPWQETLEAGLAPFISKVTEEMGRRSFDRSVLAQRLERFERSREEIMRLAGPLLEELASAVEILEGMGYPFALEQLGISLESCMLPARSVRLLRSRYSSYDLAYELGREGEIIEGIRVASGLATIS